MNARTRLLLLLVASASLGSCVTPPPPPMVPDPERSASASPASAPRNAAPPGSAHAATPRPAGLSPTASRSAARPAALRLGDNIGVTGHLGRRKFSDLDPADNHLSFGLEVDAYDEFSFVGFEGGFLYSEDSGHNEADQKVETEVLELYAGVRKTFTAADGRLHPYLSAGLAYLNMKAAFTPDVDPLDDDDSFGLYLRVGAYYRPTDMLRIGLDLRRMLATHLSGTGGLDLDYTQLALAVGVSF